MKKRYVIMSSGSGFWYLYRGKPRATKKGTVYSEMTKKLKDARKFATYEAAAAVLKEFTPRIFDGSERIMAITEE